MRRSALAALAAACIVVAVLTLAVSGFSGNPLVRALQSLAVFASGVALLGATIGLVLVRLGAWREPRSEREFERLVQRTEWLAAGGGGDPGGGRGEPSASAEDLAGDGGERLTGAEDLAGDRGSRADVDPFEALVRRALDELPLEFHRALEHVAIVISDRGSQANGGRGAYGLYEGDTVAQDFFHERITIFRDTLQRDFGHDPELLRAQVARTLRHELAHHLGWGEKGVRGLGL